MKIGLYKKAKAPTSVKKLIVAKGTQIRLSSSHLFVKVAKIQALDGTVNTEPVIVGGSNADVATHIGVELQPLQVLTLRGVDLYDWWIDGKAAEGVCVTYQQTLTLS